MNIQSLKESKAWKAIVAIYWVGVIGCALFFYYLIISTLF